MEIHTIGIDLAKTVFHFVGLNAHGEVVVQRRCSRSQLLRFTSNLRVCLIGMEACGGAHFLGRALRDQGHDVRLMPAQYVKPYVKTNKNDYIDAEAIAEAVGRPRMRFVPIKTDDQLDLQSLHRIREQVDRATHRSDQPDPRIAAGARHHYSQGKTVYRSFTACDSEEDADNKLSGILRVLLAQLQLEMQYLGRQIDESDKLILEIAEGMDSCRRLIAIPGIGPLTATATIAAIGNGAAFKKGRGFAAWLGVVPGEQSTGGKQS